MEPGGDWTEAPDIIAARLETSAAVTEILPVSRALLNEWLALLARPIRERLVFTRGRRWIATEPTPGARQALTRLQCLVREAARKHDAKGLAELEQTIAFVAGGHSAGEAALVKRLALAEDSELRSLARHLPGRSIAGNDVEVQLTGMVVWGPAKAVMDGLVSSECPAYRPPSSISTAP